MRRLLIGLAAVFGAAGLAVPVALAGNAHFIGNATTVSISTTGATAGDLTCSFKEAGLESGSVETITCDATATVTYECVNGGNHNPSASNKTTTQTQVAPTGQFPASKNGNVVGSLTATVPSATDVGFSCPSGQKVTFVSVTYSGISITDQQSLATLSFGDTTLSYTNPSAP
jgi:hypothetical protein